MIHFKRDDLRSSLWEIKPVQSGTARALTVFASLAILAATALVLIYPHQVYSRVMTWDLLFNLSGAWAIYNGLTLHTDFHDPLGGASFWLTTLGFIVGGVSVWSFVVGKLMMTGVVFLIALAVTFRRLSPLPATLFVLMVSLLCLSPINTGDLLDDFTFAMSYNLYGWSVVSVLALTMYLSPEANRLGHWIDLASFACLLLILFYLKITYFLAGIGIFATALLVNPSVLARWRSWMLVFFGTVAIALGPWNWPYWRDIFSAINSGAVRSRLLEHLFTFSANVMEISLYLTLLALTVALWRLKWIAFRVMIAILSLYIAGAAILSQNAQQRIVPLCVVALFLLYRELDNRSGEEGLHRRFLKPLLILPAMICLHTMLSVAVYAKRASTNPSTYIVQASNLKGLAIPIEPVPAAQFVSARSGDYSALTRARSIHGNPPLSQVHYLRTIIEAVEILGNGSRAPGGVAVLDQVNPFPYALGWRPPSGGNLWYDNSFPWPREEIEFADVQYVLIPKFATSADVLNEAWQRYGAYLGKYFRMELETESWKLLTRL